jgi:hypothetical protein
MEKYRENTAYPAIGFPHDRSISGITGVPGALCRLEISGLAGLKRYTLDIFFLRDRHNTSGRKKFLI